MYATCDTDADIAYGVVSYPVGPDRGMLGKRTTRSRNGGAVAVAKRRVSARVTAAISIFTECRAKPSTLSAEVDEFRPSRPGAVLMASESLSATLTDIGARAHHVVEILPLQGERRHEGLGPRERGTIDRKVQRLDAVLDEGDDLARLELRTRNDLRKATSLEGFQELSLAPILRWTWFEADPQPHLQGAVRQKESAHERRRRGLRRTPVRGRG
jgi:hypothetical protein